MNQRDVVASYIVLSLAAAGVLLLISWVSSAQGRELTFSDKLIVGAAFMASCVFGIVQSTKPNWLKRRSQKHRTSALGSGSGGQRRRIGHHPDCNGFKDHVVAVNGKKYCSGCLGLALGSSIALPFMAAYLLIPTISPSFGMVLILSGLALVSMDLVETAIHSRAQKLHVLANLLLIVGFLLVTIGVSGATGSGAYGLLAVLISFLWLDTRIQISDWKHAKICDTCGQDCKSY